MNIEPIYEWYRRYARELYNPNNMHDIFFSEKEVGIFRLRVGSSDKEWQVFFICLDLGKVRLFPGNLHHIHISSAGEAALYSAQKVIGPSNVPAFIGKALARVMIDNI